MDEDQEKKASSSEESEQTESHSNLCCCYVLDPCGCYYNPCCVSIPFCR